MRGNCERPKGPQTPNRYRFIQNRNAYNVAGGSRFASILSPPFMPGVRVKSADGTRVYVGGPCGNLLRERKDGQMK